MAGGSNAARFDSDRRTARPFGAWYSFRIRSLTGCERRLMGEHKIVLVYDHQCPVCDAYCRRVQIRPAEGALQILDARSPSEIRDEVTRRGLDIDQGMVLQTDTGLYYGAEAIHQLALLGSRSDAFNWLNFVAFRRRWAADMLYPILRFFRNMLLKLLGRTRINNLSLPHNDRF